MNPIGSIASLSGDLLIGVIAGLVFIEESGIPVPFAPGDLLLIIAGIAIASDTVEPIPMVAALLATSVLGAMIGREVFAAVGRPALMKAADALGFRPALERATRLLRSRGAPAVFIGRLIPGLRISTTQVAGVSKMPRLTFAAGLIPSVVVYIAFFVGLGELAGHPAVRLFRRGALTALEPIVLGVRRELADTIDAAIFPTSEWRQYPLVRRLWAVLIDLAIVFIVAILILTAVSGLDTTEIVLDPEGFLLLTIIAMAYRVPIEARTGQTIGKTLMGISVYGPDDGVPGWWRATVRNLIGVLVPLWPIDAVLLVRNRRRQRLGDHLTRTTVRR